MPEELYGLKESLERHANIVDGTGMALQTKIGASAEKLTTSIDSLAAAARESAAAANRYARQLVFATWALALVSGILVVVTWIRA